MNGFHCHGLHCEGRLNDTMPTTVHSFKDEKHMLCGNGLVRPMSLWAQGITNSPT